MLSVSQERCVFLLSFLQREKKTTETAPKMWNALNGEKKFIQNQVDAANNKVVWAALSVL